MNTSFFRIIQTTADRHEKIKGCIVDGIAESEANEDISDICLFFHFYRDYDGNVHVPLHASWK